MVEGEVRNRGVGDQAHGLVLLKKFDEDYGM